LTNLFLLEKQLKAQESFTKSMNVLTEQVIEEANNYYQVYVRRQNLNVLDSTYINTNKVKNIIKGRYDNGLSKKLI
jgi:hypothetical protein